MANKSVQSFMAELQEKFNTRRGFLTGAAGAIATGAAFQVAPDKSSSIEEMASALHDVIGQFDDENAPSHVQVCNDGQSLNLAMEVLLESSVEEIEHLLSPLFGRLT